MAVTCPSFLRGNVMRVTRLNACGQPIYGDCNQVVSDGFVTISLSADVEEGEEISVTKANGQTCISDRGCDTLRWYTVETEFCQVDPTLVQMMNPTWDLIYDAQGDVIGYDANGTLDCDTGFALEIWLDTYGATDVCTGQEAQGAWGYMLLPWVVGGAPGDIEIGNDALSFTYTGRTKIGSRWRRGPYPVQLNENNVPTPLLTPIGPDTHYRLFVTTIRPPEPECGCQPVDRPTPDPAELTIVGIPNESPRMTVRMRPDNHGFGPVIIDWGDGTPPQESPDGMWVTHTYAEEGEYTIIVSDKETPVVRTTKVLPIPLPPDEPEVELSGADPEQPFLVQALITMPPQSDGRALVNWGDGTDIEEVQVGDDGTITVTHLYANPSIYTVVVRRADQEQYRGRDSIQVPVVADLGLTLEEDTADATRMTVIADWNNGPDGPVTIDFGDGTGPQNVGATGPLSYQYTEPGTYTVTVTSQADPTKTESAEVTVPFGDGGDGPVVTAEQDPADPTGFTVLLNIDNTGTGGDGPEVSAGQDPSDPTGYTAQLTIDNSAT